jgi:hypothetical protein
MDLLIKHGTWILVPIGLFLSFAYLHIFPKVYPFLLARRLDEQDGRQSILRARAKRRFSAAPPLRFDPPATAGRRR